MMVSTPDILSASILIVDDQEPNIALFKFRYNQPFPVSPG